MYSWVEKGKEEEITQNLKIGKGKKGKEEDYTKVMFF
jgi:hypothetical protein